MVKTRTLKETQTAYSLSLDKADLTQSPLIVEHEGEAVAALVPITEYRHRPIYVQIVDEHLPRVRLPSVWIAR
jgi:hypothetical protein